MMPLSNEGRGLAARSAILAGVLAGLALLAALPAKAESVCDRNRDSIAIVIGNRDYESTIAVPYAVNAARAIKRFLVEEMCYRDGNVVLLENATFNHLRNWLGTADNPRGQLWNWALPGRSDVMVYYSGHGAPDRNSGGAFIVPVDGNPDMPALGFALDTLERNLAALKSEVLGPGRDLVLMLDACFSGKTSSGEPLIKGSFTGWTPKFPEQAGAILRFSAAGADEIARWDEDAEHGLFTRVFLEAVAGAADRGFHGDKDGVVTGAELIPYLADEVRYAARRKWGSDQTPGLPAADALGWHLAVGKAYAPGTSFKDCQDCPEMVALPTGSFAMGSATDDPFGQQSETPQHEVSIARPFALARTELTVAEFRTFVEATGYRPDAGCRVWRDGRWQSDPAATWDAPGFAQADDEPVVCVSKLDATAYLDWLNATAGGNAAPYRLPSEAEWEYAARGGQQ
ncbi:MAG: SUMF1/EgtB/PvdO family nonheme iron enzyme, partial [Hyphomicrobiales bacterium]|nr:SUMF1/EgtB/PvdO family nonheme iron enzyme [Hyphomicrobiales bacterium]